MQQWKDLDITDRLEAQSEQAVHALPATGQSYANVMMQAKAAIEKLRKENAESAKPKPQPFRYRIPTKYRFHTMKWDPPTHDHPVGITSGTFDDGTGCEYCINEQYDYGRLTDDEWANEWLSYIERLGRKKHEAQSMFKSFLSARRMSKRWSYKNSAEWSMAEFNVKGDDES